MPRLSKIGAAALAAFGWTSGGGISVSYLVVAGGGGGGGTQNGNWSSGGGGAGGYQTGASVLVATESYTVTVGAGGNGGASGGQNNGTSGSNSVFSTITSTGGGGGAGGSTAASTNQGLSGGSGGGSSYGSPGGSGNTPSTSPSQGNNGGSGAAGGSQYGGGGGGGASAVGSDGTSGAGGNGGNGTASSISGSSVTYAGGGGGGGYTSGGTVGSGGSGGGGAGGKEGTAATNGSTNTGGGGGGIGRNLTSAAGANGGSGIVIISYAGAQQFGGGVVTSSGGNTIHTFTTSGTLSPLNSLTANFLVVAGGGGSGKNASAGGGAGGYRTSAGTSGGGASAESALTLDTNSIYTVTVGAGGAGATSSQGTNGSNSSFLSITSTGGGGGAGFGGSGNSGGSGGGGGGYQSGTPVGGAGTANQGFAGGNGSFDSGGASANLWGGGGGGAGGVGGNATNSVGGTAGAGVSSSINGSATTRALGGVGGGGVSGFSGTAGGANTGTGGGGSGFIDDGAAGGSGVVIISYAGSTQQMAGGTVTVAGGNVIHTFTSSGYLTPLVSLTKSLRFRSSANAYLNRTPASAATSRRIMTYSAWVKLGILETQRLLYEGYTSVSDFEGLVFNTSNQLEWTAQVNGGTSYGVRTPAVFRDPSAWYHIVCAVDTTQATSTNRVRIYVNGVEQTGLTTFYSGFPAQNEDLEWNNQSSTQVIGWGGHFGYYDGYMAEINMVDGQALTPNSFGYYSDLGVWQPIRYGGSYGVNGFYLPFTNNTSTTTLGLDFSPNGNNWTTNNFSLATLTAVESFTSSTTWTAPTGVTSVSYLVVAGGGGGGGDANSTGGGGGGGGGYRTGTLTVVPGIAYTVTVGAGGAGGATGRGSSGLNSVFSTITSTGGGGGGGSPFDTVGSGASGGSGGGGKQEQLGGAGNTPSTSPSQGNNGGNSNSVFGAAGGGGAGGAAANTASGTNQPATAGGAGTSSSISGSSVAYSGGGGGGNGNTNAAANGTDGGGNGVNSGTGGDGAANRGGGGGGAGGAGTPRNGGAGGSGIVIISYAVGSATTYDSMTDVPTLTNTTTANYCTWSPINRRTTVNIKDTLNGNLDVSGQSNQTGLIYATMYPISGKWYFEFSPANTYLYSYIGIGANNCENINQYPGNSTNSVGLEIGTGNVYRSSLVATYTGISAGEIGMIAWDCDTGKVWMGRQGTWFNSGNPAAGTGQVVTLATGENGPMVTPYSSSGVISTTFGQRPFRYTPPTGFNRLNTFNLAAPPSGIGTTAATTANKYFDAVLYSGNNSTQNIAVGFQPDFVWSKCRNVARSHRLSDAVRGSTRDLYSDTTGAEQNDGSITSFISTGFSLNNATGSQYNTSGENYVSWAWKANGAGVTNTDGSISATVSVNPTAGFSIVAYTGNGTNGATVGHGLGAKPFLIIEKGRTSTFAWSVQGCGELWTPATSNLFLDNTNGLNANGAVAAPTNTVFTPSAVAYANESGVTNIAYCFAPVAGYSKIGTYVGNDLNDGTFVFTGFRPAFVLYKKLGTDGWAIYDAKRNTYNVTNAILQPDNNGQEVASNPGSIDILANGFKQRNSNNFGNSSGFTYIYMAFAETPFKYANAR